MASHRLVIASMLFSISVVPSAMSIETLDYTIEATPGDARISIVTMPGEWLAAIEHSGNWSRERLELFEARLAMALSASDWQICGPGRWARYDPPFRPAFMRRNEVLIPLGQPCE